MNIPTHKRRFHQRGLTLIELLVSLAIAAMLLVGLRSVMGNVLGSAQYQAEHNALVRDAEFAMDRIVRTVSHSPRLLLPLPDNPGTNWPEHIREQTVPASPPVGASTLSTAVLAVTLPEYVDLDFDGSPDADNDNDGRIDEDPFGDVTADGASGIYQVDDDGDGSVDEDVTEWWNDDEDGSADEDPLNGLDDDGDGNIDEDPFMDMNLDGQAGVLGVDDDDDGGIDEGSSWDNDEDGTSSEDPYEPLVYTLVSGQLIERLPVPWDEDGDSLISGRDFVSSPIADNVTLLRFERVPTSAGQPELVDITLELTTAEAGTVAVNSRVRLGGAL